MIKPDRASGDRRFFEILRILAANHSVDLAVHARSSESDGKYREMLRSNGARVLSQSAAKLTKILLSRVYDAVVCEFWQSASWQVPLIRRLQPWATVIVDSVDVHFLREEAGLSLGLLSAEVVAKNKAAEIAAYRSADIIIAVSAEDDAVLGEACPAMPKCLVPNIVEIHERPKIQRDACLLFVGGFNHQPNVDGLLWFVKECWPQVRRVVPEALLRVVGSNVTSEIGAFHGLDGIEILGYVDSLQPLLDQTAVSIAPLRYGGGMKGKVTEALASGLPVVTTTFGAQGLGARSGEHLLIADTVEQFSEGVVKLLTNTDDAERMGRVGQTLVETVCGRSYAASTLKNMLSRISGRRPRFASLALMAMSAFACAEAPLRNIGRRSFLR